MTAEFAVLLPSVLIVIALVVGAVMLSAHRLALVSAANDVARLEARGDAGAAQARLGALAQGVEVTREQRDGLLCVTLDAAPGSGPLRSLRISASACAAMTDTSDL